jgi:hypothetical protein
MGMAGDKGQPLIDSLPRLLYWADVPVQPTRSGALQMYRLLKAWPADKLLVVTAEGCDLPGVRHVKLPPSPMGRLSRTRVAKHYLSLLMLKRWVSGRVAGSRGPRWLRSALREFEPEAVLTIAASFSWVQAAALARSRNLPLHLIVHDDDQYSHFWIDALRPLGERLFGATYRAAASRLCVSRRMEEYYRDKLGVSGDVLLPCRGPECVAYREPRNGSPDVSRGLRIFHAGSLGSASFPRLDAIAGELRARGHRLTLCTNSRPQAGFVARHIDFENFPSSADLVRALHEKADFLLLYSDFTGAKRRNIETQFPSKAVDYTAAAVPILVVAPPYAAISEYARARPSVGRLLDLDEPAMVADAIEEIARDSEHWRRMGASAASAGLEDFGHEQAFVQFCAAFAKTREG